MTTSDKILAQLRSKGWRCSTLNDDNQLFMAFAVRGKESYFAAGLDEADAARKLLHKIESVDTPRLTDPRTGTSG